MPSCAISSAIHGRMNAGAASGTSGGTAVVRFTVMRSGQVTGAGLARSSGVGQIDSAALSAVRGSLPPAPAGVTQSSLSVSVTSTWAQGADATVSASYPWSIDVMGVVVASGTMTSTTTERVE